MELIAAEAVAILGRYVAKGADTLTAELGKKATEVARRLFSAVMGKLSTDPDQARDAEQFEKRPEVYEKPLQAAVESQLSADPAFASVIRSLLEEFKAAAPEVQIVQTGSGAIAMSGGVAAGQGGAAAGAGGTAVVGSIGEGKRSSGTNPH